MEKEYTCCVTGHRKVPDDRIEFVRARLKEEVLAAINEGFTHFISGFAAGVDLIFAEIVAELKFEHPITLEAAVPYLGRMNTPDSIFQRLISACDVVKICSDHYFDGCYMVRNRYMVDNSSLVIAVYDERKSGGTAATVKYASRTQCTIREICL